MPNQHSPDLEPLSLQIPRQLKRKLAKRAKSFAWTLPEFIRTTLETAAQGVVLTSKDYEAIAEATRKAERTGSRCATRFDDPA